MEKSPDAYRTISEVAEELNLPQHVLRFWETRFPQIKPMKRGGNRRFYKPGDVELLRAIKSLLYGDGYTIKGVQRILKDQGPRAVANLAQSGPTTSLKQSAQPPESTLDAPAPNLVERKQLQHAAAPSLEFRSAGATVGSEREPETDARFSDEPQASSAAPWPSRAALEAVLFELSECERILAAARSPA